MTKMEQTLMGKKKERKKKKREVLDQQQINRWCDNEKERSDGNDNCSMARQGG